MWKPLAQGTLHTPKPILYSSLLCYSERILYESLAKVDIIGQKRIRTHKKRSSKKNDYCMIVLPGVLSTRIAQHLIRFPTTQIPFEKLFVDCVSVSAGIVYTVYLLLLHILAVGWCRQTVSCTTANINEKCIFTVLCTLFWVDITFGTV